MKRTDLINFLIQKHNYKSYLEIGVQYGENFKNINAETKIGVDPMESEYITHNMTSDEFFANNKEKFDIIFIDGLHEYLQVVKDIKNSLSSLNTNGIILVHDCLPKTKKEQKVPRVQGYWTGDGWKAVFDIMSTPNVNVSIVNTETGIAIIKKGENNNKIDKPDYYDYEYFINNKHKLNIVTLKSIIGDIANSKAVYTILLGKYDNLKTPVVADGWDYICYTDQKIKSDVWEIRPFNGNKLDIKRLKLLGIKELHEEGYSDTIYIDASFEITSDINSIPFDGTIITGKHPDRNCIYEEFRACSERNKDDISVMQSQIDKYKKDGYPLNNGMTSSGFIYRRYTDETVEFMEKWFDEIKNGSIRDQLSFNYVAWKFGYNHIAIDYNEFLKLHSHKFSEPVNVLIRTSNREVSFKRCLSSVIEQTFKNIEVFVSVDNDIAEKYVYEISKELNVNINVVNVKKPSDEPGFYNDYLNHLLDAVRSGWIIILDDDDYLLSTESIGDLHKNLTSKNVIYLYKVRHDTGILVPSKIHFGLPYVIRGKISMSGFCIHSSNKSKVKFKIQYGGDFQFVTEMLKFIPPKWLDIAIIGVGNRGLRGKMIDIDKHEIIGDIYYFIPYSINKNLGDEYNKYMRLLPNENDIAVLTDGDIMFLNPNWGDIIRNVVKKYGYGIYTCLTNRIGMGSEQLYGNKISLNSDIKYHKKLADALFKKNEYKVLKATNQVSGFLLVINKSIWKSLGGFATDLKFLGVDNQFTKEALKCKIPIYIMQGLYVFHYYRFIEGFKHTKHLK